MSDSESRYLKIGYPIDQLLNTRCGLPPNGKPYEEGGIRFPLSDDEAKNASGGSDGDDGAGSGNIVIIGKPGTGKSTLALQMAVACCQEYNDGPKRYAVYFPLEQPFEHVEKQASSFGWDKHLKPVRHLHGFDGQPSEDQLADYLASVLTQPSKCPFRTRGDLPSNPRKTGLHTYHCVTSPKECNNPPRCVLVSAMSPRRLPSADADAGALFWERYRQLEHVLLAARTLGERNDDAHKELPKLGIVCLDSLNMFSNTALRREELFRIFDLCRRNQVIGIFTAERGDGETPGSGGDMDYDVIEYLADVLIFLDFYDDKGYYLRSMQVAKSRLLPQANGKHPFRIVSSADATFAAMESDLPRITKGVVVYPSLDYSTKMWRKSR